MTALQTLPHLSPSFLNHAPVAYILSLAILAKMEWAVLESRNLRAAKERYAKRKELIGRFAPPHVRKYRGGAMESWLRSTVE